MKKRLAVYFMMFSIGVVLTACGTNKELAAVQKPTENIDQDEAGKTETPEQEEEQAETEEEQGGQTAADIPTGTVPEDYDEPVLSGSIAEISGNHFSIYESFATVEDDGTEVAVMSRDGETKKIKVENNTVVVRRRTSYETYESEILPASLDEIAKDVTVGLWGTEEGGEFIASLVMLWEFY